MNRVAYMGIVKSTIVPKITSMLGTLRLNIQITSKNELKYQIFSNKNTIINHINKFLDEEALQDYHNKPQTN